ncbi:hypothetical protein CCHR01_14344 [Colletotrichum chrysophilum]|uniref:Uncharacterized protein n=1 Tax=Colletotrichum chrysophilum TaxID=1836956 RepID=A0AAD9A884_9PEZI|nr:hypothetical protein CCHR01_14344 [Colletotrichum chrysophilum]
MASTFGMEDALEAIQNDGFYCIHDSAIGRKISDMEEKRSQFSTSSVAGLEFYRLNVFQDERIRNVLESSFEWCALGDYRRICEDPGHIFQLRRGGAKADILIVQLWSARAHAVYYNGSHLVSRESLNSVRAANRMWEVPLAKLERAGSEAREVSFEQGGIVIMDARLAFETRHGSPITCSFATEHQLKTWPKLVPPKPHDDTNMLAELQSKRIGAHFANVESS